MAKILIVEDEKILSDMYKNQFLQEGYEVCQARTAQEGIERAQEDHPDFILLDILLLESNGITFLEERNRDSKISSIPVLAFSAYNDAETKARAKELGVIDYFLKTDFTPNQLIAWINNFLKT